jgi:hypothetical protein
MKLARKTSNVRYLGVGQKYFLVSTKIKWWGSFTKFDATRWGSVHFAQSASPQTWSKPFPKLFIFLDSWQDLVQNWLLEWLLNPIISWFIAGRNRHGHQAIFLECENYVTQLGYRGVTEYGSYTYELLNDSIWFMHCLIKWLIVVDHLTMLQECKNLKIY